MDRLTINDFDFTANFVASNLQSFPIAQALSRLQAYEDTGLEPVEVVQLKADVDKIKGSVDKLCKNQAFLERLEERGIDADVGTKWMCDVFDILWPADYSEPITTGRLRGILDADRYGRMVVLPCRMGDSVYRKGRFSDSIVEAVVTDAIVNRFGVTFKAAWGEEVYFSFNDDDIEERVFLTRAEAEAAMGVERE